MYFPVLPTVYRKMSVFLYHYIHNESIGNYTHVPCVVFGKPSAGYCVYFISFFSYSIYRSMESLFDNN